MSRMFCCIALAVFLWSNDLKGVVISKNSKNNVADFAHYRPNGHILFLSGTFANVIIMNDRIYWSLVPLTTLRLLKAIICRIRQARLESRLDI